MTNACERGPSGGVCCSAMETIRSRRNPLVQQVRRLLASPRERHAAGMAVLDGEHLVADWVAAGHPVEQLLLAESRSHEAAAWLARDVAVTLVADDCLGAISSVETPSGVVALIQPPALQPRAEGTLLVLDGVQDPGNVGTMLRTAAACGVDQAWLGPGCADAWSPRVLRAGQGAHAVLAVCQVADPLAELAAYRGVVAALVPAGGVPVWDADLTADVALLVGSEGAGLSAPLLARADVRLTIPMPGRAESLNAGVAAGICLYERVRQRSRCSA